MTDRLEEIKARWTAQRAFIPAIDINEAIKAATSIDLTKVSDFVINTINNCSQAIGLANAGVEDIPYLLSEVERLQQWVNDLQSGMYANCVYCGHRYGPEISLSPAKAELLKAHIEKCPAHPMSALKAENAVLRMERDTAVADLFDEIRTSDWCEYCKHNQEGKESECDKCSNKRPNWEWRGVREEGGSVE